MLDTIRIPDLAFRDVLLLDVACALTVHAIYKRFEPDLSHLFVQFILLVVIPSLPAACFLPHFQQDSAILAVLSAFALFYFSLVTSIVIYRLSPWHPLAKYPGPFLAKITKLWGLSKMAKGKNHLMHKELHEKYGPYVRIGPNELSVVDVSAISSILGGDGMPKGPMWTARTGKGEEPALIGIRTMHEHARRRKAWNRAFNTSAVKGYEPIVQKRALQLVSELNKRTAKTGVPSVDLAQWLSYFATDFMGDMAFGGGFELMRDGGDKQGIWTLIESTMHIAGIYQHIPWFMPLLRRIPSAHKFPRMMREFSNELVRARKANGSLTKDLFYHLIDEDHVEKVTPTDKEITSDGTLAIIAGSDTTSTTLSGLFYYLLSNPNEYKRLQAEIDSVFPPGEGDPFDTTKLAEMPILNAVINETMRLQPPVGSYLQRAPEVGSGGKWVGDRFITEGTSVVVPPYALFRNPAYFSPAPETFWPDRWLQPNTVKHLKSSSRSESGEVHTNMAAFIPFSYGPANCAGRALALAEMRMVVALLMQRFDIQFAPEYDPCRWEEELEDHFVMANGGLPVVLTPRI
ncbi:high nitrogen upregulated cytochrome P450 monooxygenase 2 [Fomitiporia mediterranea MF3/22]|uniref:high nitrogen upregulated cytochrome P450 monooxygenase 2 n=1 Tax=Fomitiporia mediterranea (strain MF3/22) TaxID=694068 RepID=UPI00044072ED|nr:high nitrogen upregulated cytochrome P450 monooxygenase 2 [Fomitiporia mediterranea MF3/22]EJD00159.1 high nitrogen upregulated cytochrome P450 monooxygenase 2 [Fomitiporia mediterranea MF3/22]